MDLKDEKMTVFESNNDLLEAQAHIWNHIFDFINSMSLKCAIQLGIPDAIHRHGPNPMPLSLLVSSLKLHPNKTQFIYRLMRLLTYSGFFALQEEGYMLTNSSRLLLKDNPLTLTPFLLSMLDPLIIEPWQLFSACFLNDDKTLFDTAHGMSFWEYVGGRPKDNDVFNAGMASDAKLVMSVLLGKYKGVFEGLGSLVDVGGGTGTMAKAIAEAFPQTVCIVLDLPQVVANMKDNENLKYVGGDMFEAIPPADALLLKSTSTTYQKQNQNIKKKKKKKERRKKSFHIANCGCTIVYVDYKKFDALISLTLLYDRLL
ncbi:trans-resveratrol di-O-methyltransferase-like isoform X2 [Benincasa hispida]|uniref:trans-resveratrol di-O-methyltransferase-like isoform X2 n=1 Tax=Benincasa hispida TaxID=102211 RepID=UPI0018FF6F91|nr:trans-resveratrol di-O-methyltransferase-like isoform X2 [Benincasa hispida]